MIQSSTQAGTTLPENAVATRPHCRALWAGAVVLFTLVCLWPIWSVRFPSMQDYPQHLLQAHLLTPQGRSSFDFKQYFEFKPEPTYVAFSSVTVLCSHFVPIEVAGKCGVSLYILLMAAVVVTVAHQSDNKVAWGALLFLPFAFNQLYFIGSVNYCYSLPLLWLALIHQERLATKPVSLRQVCGHIALLIALVLAHSFSLLIYLVLTFAAFLRRPNYAHISKVVWVLLGAAALLFGWLAPHLRSLLSALGPVVYRVGWKPLGETLGFFCYMFTGMRWHDGLDLTTVVLWFVILGSAGIACALERTWVQPRFRKNVSFFVVALVGLVTLPFNINDINNQTVTPIWTFISLRLAPVSYLALASLISTIRFRGIWAVTFVTCVGLLLVQSVGKQRRISREIEQIMPVIKAMPSNAKILPLVFDRNSPELDPQYFDPHLHAPNYYHVIVGGGVNPYIFATPIQPVRFKRGANLPAPGEYTPFLFRWEQHADDYQYFLLRGAPLPFVLYLSATTKMRAQSGEWLLFERTAVRSDNTSPN